MSNDGNKGNSGGSGKGRDLNYQQHGGKTGSTFKTYKGGKYTGVDTELKDKIEGQKLEKFHKAGQIDEVKTGSLAINIIGNATLGWTNAGSVKTREYFTNKVLESKKSKTNIGYTKSEFKNLSSAEQEKVYDSYMSNRMSGKTDAYGNTHPNYTKEKDGTFRKTGGDNNQTRKTEAQILQENVDAEKKDQAADEQADYSKKKRLSVTTSRSLFANEGKRGFFN
tara:strand:+ start:2074 stop:2742 length:669 start_codon:yes stop_codon:yes gene_type:complete